MTPDEYDAYELKRAMRVGYQLLQWGYVTSKCNEGKSPITAMKVRYQLVQWG